MVGLNIKIDDFIVNSVDHFADTNLAGQCVMLYNTTATITMDSTYWAVLDVYDREELFFHELGHCILSRKHRADGGATFALSIMYPSVLSDNLYLANYGQYIHELFTETDIGPLPLVVSNEDPTYVASISPYFAGYPGAPLSVSKNMRIKDESAPPFTTLTPEELSKLGCGSN